MTRTIFLDVFNWEVDDLPFDRLLECNVPILDGYVTSTNQFYVKYVQQTTAFAKGVRQYDEQEYYENL